MTANVTPCETIATWPAGAAGQSSSNGRTPALDLADALPSGSVRIGSSAAGEGEEIARGSPGFV